MTTRPTTKQLLPFRSFLFNVKQLAEILSVSRAIIYQYEKEGFIEGVVVPSGSAEKKVFGWDDVAKLGARLRHRQPALTANKIKVFANMKGGVGKSTIASQFAMRAACCGFKTLLVDLDAQAHATHILGVPEAEREAAPTIQDAIVGDNPLPVQSLIRPLTPLLSIIPANLNLSSLDMEMFTLAKREERIGRLLRSIRDDWDIIVVDTAPYASLVTINAILAADEICTVASTEYLAVAGLQKLFRIMRDLQEQFEHSPAVRIIPQDDEIEIAACPENLRAFGAPDGTPWSEIKSPHGLMESAWPQLRDFFRGKRAAQQQTEASTQARARERDALERRAAADDAVLAEQALIARTAFVTAFPDEATQVGKLEKFCPRWVSNPLTEPGRSLAIDAWYHAAREAQS